MDFIAYTPATAETANSYLNIIDFNSLVDFLSMISIDPSDFEVPAKENALMNASLIIDSFQVPGSKFLINQNLEYPREIYYDPTAPELSDNIKFATSYIASEILSGNINNFYNISENIISEAVGTISVTYDKPRKTDVFSTYPYLKSLLSKYINFNKKIVFARG